MFSNLDERKIAELQKNTARLALFTATLLCSSKFVVSYFTHSMAILASAVDSLTDIAASGINYFSIRKSLKPADQDHQFGHGKAESLAGFVQSLIMISSSFYVIYTASLKIIKKNQIEEIDIGMAVMLFSSLISLALVLRMHHVAKLSKSIALKADSLHYLTDVLTNAGVLISLWIISLTGLLIVDLIISIIIGLYIGIMAWQVLRESVDVLMDRSLPEKQLQSIHCIIEKFYPDIKSYHKLRTRKAGSILFIDLHIVMPGIRSFKKAHTIAESLTVELQKEFTKSQINIHIDPRDDQHEPTNQGGGIYCSLG